MHRGILSLFIGLFLVLGAGLEAHETLTSTTSTHTTATKKIRKTSVLPNGVDIRIHSAICNATPVYNEPDPNDPKQCYVGIFTAGHCIGGNAESVMQFGSLTLNSSEVQLVLDKNYDFSNTFSGDSAMAIFKRACDEVAFLIPAKVAEVQPNGTVEAPQEIYMQKRESECIDRRP